MGEVEQFGQRVGRTAGGLTGKGGEEGASPAETRLSEIAEQLFQETTPLRQGLVGRSEQFLEGGLDPTASPLFAPLKGATEEQFGTAREVTLATLPEGGALQAALADIEGQKAGALTQGIGDITEGELNRALTLATGAPQTAVAGFGGAANIQAQRAQAQASREAATKQAAGQGAGAYFGSK